MTRTTTEKGEDRAENKGGLEWRGQPGYRKTADDAAAGGNVGLDPKDIKSISLIYSKLSLFSELSLFQHEENVGDFR